MNASKLLLPSWVGLSHSRGGIRDRSRFGSTGRIELENLRGPIPDLVEQAFVVGEFDADGRNHLAKLALPTLELGREAALEHVQHRRNGRRRTGRSTEQAGDGTVLSGDHRGAEFEFQFCCPSTIGSGLLFPARSPA